MKILGLGWLNKKSSSTDLKIVQGALIKCMVMKVRFKSVEKEMLFNRPKNFSSDLSLMHSDEF